VQSLRFVGDQVVCQSSAVGELSFPLSQLAEIIFDTQLPAVAPTKPTPVISSPDEPPTLEEFLKGR
jgi:hypothetical protein